MTKKRSPRTRQPSRGGALRRLFWTDRALTDLEAIGDYIARDNPSAAERWIAQLMAVAESAAQIPLAARRVPELGRDDVREIFKRTYRIVYRVTDKRVEVLTVFEGHRLFPDDVLIDAGER